MKRFASASFCLLLALCLLGGCAAPADSVITCGDISLSLPADFTDLKDLSVAQSADFLYGRDTLIVMGLSEPKESLPSMTLEEYTSLVIQGNGLDVTWEKLPGGCRFAYEAPVGEDTYTYVAMTCEGPDNFWIVQCYCPKGTLSGNIEAIDRILESISTEIPAGN